MNIIIEIIFLLVILFILILNVSYLKVYKDLIKLENKTKLSGFEVAKKIVDKYQKETHIIKKKGRFLDHYNYERNVIKLSPEVFDGTSIYAAAIALNIALEVDDDKLKITKKRKITAFLIMASYIMIILGAFLNNSNIILFGFILFILAFILEVYILRASYQSMNYIEEFYSFAGKEHLIEPYEEIKKLIISLITIHIARLPYSFINYFR